MKKIYLSVFALQLLFIYKNSTAQVEDRDGLMMADSYPGGIVETRELEKSSVVEGSFFVNNNWSVGNVILYSGKAIKGMPLKYNLSGAISSEIKIDKQSGWIIEAHNNQDIAGEVQVQANPKMPMTMTIPMTMKNETVIKGN